MAIEQFLEDLKVAPFSMWLADTPNVVPAVQTVHIIGVALFFPAALFLGLRLAGLLRRGQTVASLAEKLTPWMWVGLAMLLPTGVLLFLEDPANLYFNNGFRAKMLMLVLGGLGLWAFQAHRRRHPEFWEQSPSIARGGFSLTVLALWCGVIASGRWIAYLAYF